LLLSEPITCCPRCTGTRIADKAFDADEWAIQLLAAAGKTAVIPPKADRQVSRDYDRDLFKAWHPIENFFAKLKPTPPTFCPLACRSDK